ncbi:MAG: glycosyltransferase family 39 protein [Candidatus Lambdaproteobacteria bacterium]|nr:glycosyltransferase family 39 protein [Candidatus Lambdaproteobacteria bacterium]
MTRLFRDHRPLALLVLVAAAAHLVLIAVPPLNGDEAFYWEWSRNLAPGYYTHPPMTAWVIALVTAVLGTSKLTLRLTSLLLHLGTLLLVYRMALDATRSRRIAFTAATLYAVMPVSVLLGTLITTDCSLIFFWTAASYATKLALVDGRRGAWWWAGAAAGGALLTKFFSLLFFPGVFLFVVLGARYRRVLLDWRPYAAFALALLLFSPFIYWNATHHWYTFQFNLVARNRNEGFSLLKPVVYLAGQAIAASPVLLPLLLAALWRYVPGSLRTSAPAAADEPARQQADGLRFYGTVADTPMAVFLLQSFMVEVGAHWIAVIYPLGAVLIAAWLHQVGTPQAAERIVHARAYWAGLAGAALVGLPIAALMLFPTLLPARYLYIDPARPAQHEINNYFGWREVGRHIAALREQYGGAPAGFFLSTTDYSIGSMLDFYTPGHAEFTLIGYGEKEFHGKEFLYWRNPLKTPGADTLFVSDVAPPEGQPHRIAPYFKSVQQLPPLIVRDGQGRILRIFYFALGRHYLGNEPDRLPR